MKSQPILGGSLILAALLLGSGFGLLESNQETMSMMKIPPMEIVAEQRPSINKVAPPAPEDDLEVSRIIRWLDVKVLK